MPGRFFKVLLNQEGTNNPMATGIENTTGSFDPTFQREAEGCYICNHPEIGFGKCGVLFGPAAGAVITIEPILSQLNIMRFKCLDVKGKPVDGKLKDTFLQVEFYRHL